MKSYRENTKKIPQFSFYNRNVETKLTIFKTKTKFKLSKLLSDQKDNDLYVKIIFKRTIRFLDFKNEQKCKRNTQDLVDWTKRNFDMFFPISSPYGNLLLTL